MYKHSKILPKYVLFKNGKSNHYNFGDTKGLPEKKMLEADEESMDNKDVDVTDKFLHIIRERRKTKYGRMLYSSDKAMEDNFDADKYFKELMLRNKIRDKIKQARKKRNNPKDTEDQNENENSPSLSSRIVKEPREQQVVENHGDESSRSTLQQHDHISTNKDSGKGTPSADTVQSYNDGSPRRSSPSKTMQRVKLKLRTTNTLSTACNELKQRYKREKEKQMELLETIRLLRGIEKQEFYSDAESSSENDDVWQEDHKPEKQNIRNENKRIDERVEEHEKAKQKNQNSSNSNESVNYKDEEQKAAEQKESTSRNTKESVNYKDEEQKTEPTSKNATESVVDMEKEQKTAEMKKPNSENAHESVGFSVEEHKTANQKKQNYKNANENVDDMTEQTAAKQKNSHSKNSNESVDDNGKDHKTEKQENQNSNNENKNLDALEEEDKTEKQKKENSRQENKNVGERMEEGKKSKPKTQNIENEKRVNDWVEEHKTANQKKQNRKNANTNVEDLVEEHKSAQQKNRKNKNGNESVYKNDSEIERVLSPIYNQLLTPERESSPECAISTANVSPEPDETRSSQVFGSDVHTDNLDTGSELNLSLENKDNKRRSTSVVHTSRCKVDTRWPRGHKLFTKLSPRNPGLQKQKTYFPTYEQQTLLENHPRKVVEKIRVRKHAQKLKKLCHEHDTWRQTLIRIAYEKEFAYLKRRSLHLFPFQESSLETMISLDMAKHSTVNTTKAINVLSLVKDNSKKARQKHSPPRKDVKCMERSSAKTPETKSRSLNTKESVEVTRTKSGHASNDQGYDTDDNEPTEQHQQKLQKRYKNVKLNKLLIHANVQKKNEKVWR